MIVKFTSEDDDAAAARNKKRAKWLKSHFSFLTHPVLRKPLEMSTVKLNKTRKFAVLDTPQGEPRTAFEIE